MENVISKNSKLMCLAMVLLMVLSVFLSPAASVSAAQLNSNNELSIEEINEAVGESVYYSEKNQNFFIDEVSAKWDGLDDNQISNVKEWINFINNDKALIEDTLKYAGYYLNGNDKDGEHRIQKRALPALLIVALKVLGTGAVAAVGGAVAKYGMKGACSRIGLKYGPFANFCRANGWRPGIIGNGGGGTEF